MGPEAIAILATLLALRPDWSPGYCEQTYPDGSRGQEVCIERQEVGYKWAEEISPLFLQEADRQGLDPLLVVAVAYRESRLEGGDVCRITIDGDRIVRRVVDGHREAVTFRTYNGQGQLTRTVTILSEDEDGTLHVDRCSAGEVGLMQLVGDEVGAGVLIPVTGEKLPNSRTQRREIALDPSINISLGAQALIRSRDFQCKPLHDQEKYECEQDPINWVGAYNTGRRHGEAWERYRDRIDATMELILPIYNEVYEDEVTPYDLPFGSVVEPATEQCSEPQVQQ